MKKLLSLILVFFLLNTNAVFGAFNSSSNISKNKQDIIIKEINGIYSTFETNLSKLSKEKQIESIEKISTQMSSLIQKQRNETSKFVLEYLDYLLNSTNSELQNGGVNLEIDEQITTCPSGYHLENNKCEDNTTICVITNGAGQRTWKDNARGNTCENIICKPRHELINGECVNLNECLSNEHREGNYCIENIETCYVENGNGTKTWSNNAWGECKDIRCNTGYAMDNGKCELNEFWNDKFPDAKISVYRNDTISNNTIVAGETNKLVFGFQIKGTGNESIKITDISLTPSLKNMSMSHISNVKLFMDGSVISTKSGFNFDNLDITVDSRDSFSFQIMADFANTIPNGAEFQLLMPTTSIKVKSLGTDSSPAVEYQDQIKSEGFVFESKTGQNPGGETNLSNARISMTPGFVQSSMDIYRFTITTDADRELNMTEIELNISGAGLPSGTTISLYKGSMSSSNKVASTILNNDLSGNILLNSGNNWEVSNARISGGTNQTFYVIAENAVYPNGIDAIREVRINNIKFIDDSAGAYNVGLPSTSSPYRIDTKD